MWTVLPSLTSFDFQGVSGYLEDLLAQINCPPINTIDICYLHRPVGFRVAQLFKFINCSEVPKLTQFRCLDIRFRYGGNIGLDIWHALHDYTAHIQVSFLGKWGVSEVIQMFGQLSTGTNLSDVHHLSIEYDRDNPRIDHDDWVQFLQPFTAVWTLHLEAKHGGYNTSIGHTSETFADVLPALGLFYTGCPQVVFFEQFIAACERSGRPVTVVRKLDGFYDGLDLYLNEQDKVPYEWD